MEDLEARTNVVYFTSVCNLGCTYCYEELNNVKPKNLTIEQLYKIADNAIDNEPKDDQTLFVLFGGEATLRWDEAEKFMDYAFKKKTNVQFNLITNGIRFLEEEFFKNFFKNKHYNTGRLTIDISFDGIKGNVDRIYKDGRSSTNDVVMVFSKLNAFNLKWRLRYTIHSNNIDGFVDDIQKLCEHFNPDRVISGVAQETLNEEQVRVLNQGYEKLKFLWNTNEITTPVCSLFCDTCDGCTPRDTIADFIGTEADIHPNLTDGKFDKFESKIKINYK